MKRDMMNKLKAKRGTALKGLDFMPDQVPRWYKGEFEPPGDDDSSSGSDSGD